LVEAEDYTALDPREGGANFELVTSESPGAPEPDPDEPHTGGASGGAYLEGLPDTFTSDPEAIPNVNFFREPGAGCTLTYRVTFARAGRYFLWLRAFGGGPKDNTIFYGIDGAWKQAPVQVCGSARWRWTNSLRDEEAGGICSMERRAALEVEVAGAHNVQLSLREDGFELDQLLLTDDADFVP
jgi:hypothetical protein